MAIAYIVLIYVRYCSQLSAWINSSHPYSIGSCFTPILYKNIQGQTQSLILDLETDREESFEQLITKVHLCVTVGAHTREPCPKLRSERSNRGYWGRSVTGRNISGKRNYLNSIQGLCGGKEHFRKRKGEDGWNVGIWETRKTGGVSCAEQIAWLVRRPL